MHLFKILLGAASLCSLANAVPLEKREGHYLNGVNMDDYKSMFTPAQMEAIYANPCMNRKPGACYCDDGSNQLSALLCNDQDKGPNPDCHVCDQALNDAVNVR